jgi:hypothetical protein
MNVIHNRKILAVMLATALTSPSLYAEDSVELTDIQVIGTTPMHGVGLPADMIATNVQSADAEDIEKSSRLRHL